MSTHSHSHVRGWVWGVWVSGGEEKIELCVSVWAAIAQTLIDMSYIAWLHAVGGPQLHPLTSALHEV